MTDVAAEVRDIVVFHLGAEEALVKGAVRLVDLGADSLDVVEIAMSCEEKFDIDIAAHAAAKFVTFSDVVNFIDAHIAKVADLTQSPRLFPSQSQRAVSSSIIGQVQRLRLDTRIRLAVSLIALSAAVLLSLSSPGEVETTKMQAVAPIGPPTVIAGATEGRKS